ncbi:hypothetical protein C8R43DRAFT_1119191 [Mycena crocata]|nr:hypothetical protein C8R43DRAFT_1119191 [Mycena crocata]
MQSTEYVDRVATEVWLNCWIFCDKQQLRRLCLVCRYFTTLCQPLLFQHQKVTASHIEPGNWRSTTQSVHQTVHRLTRLAASSHAASVRTWRFTSNTSLYHLPELFPLITNIVVLRDTWIRLVQLFNTSLAAFQRLEVLHLGQAEVNLELRAALSSLGSLKDLTLAYCDISGRTGAPLQVQKFALTDARLDTVDRSIELLAPDALQSLWLDGSLTAACLLFGFDDRPLPQLVKIEIELTRHIVPLFSGLLDACPRLESLTVSAHGASPEVKDFRPLAAATIPLLTAFHGPHFVAVAIVGGRPVVDIKLHGFAHFGSAITTTELLSVLHRLAGASSSLRALAIEMQVPLAGAPELSVAIDALFPALRSLDLYFKSDLAPALNAADADDAQHDDDDDDVVLLEEEEEEEEDVDVDDGVIELWDGSLEYSSSDEPIVFSDPDSDSDLGDDISPQVVPAIPPPILHLPGHLYVLSSVSPPPALDPAHASLSAGSDASQLLASITAGRVILPAHLEDLHVRFEHRDARSWVQQQSISHPGEQHHAILELEALRPGLRVVGLGQDYTWVRAGGMWRGRDAGGGM